MFIFVLFWHDGCKLLVVMKNTVKIMIVSMVLAGGTMFVKLAKNAFELQAEQHRVNITQKNTQRLAIEAKAINDAEKALDEYNKEVYGVNHSKQTAKDKKQFKFDTANYNLKDIDIKDIDLASLKTEDFNIKFATQDSNVLLRLWKKNPKEFLNNKI